MGLIRAAISAVGGTMADQWKEFFICESLDADVLAVKIKKNGKEFLPFVIEEGSI